MIEILFAKPLECAAWIGIAFIVGNVPPMVKLMNKLVWNRMFPPQR